MIRIESLGHRCALLALLLAAGCSGGSGGGESDETPPEFAGLDTVTAAAPGTAHLSWVAANEPSTYRVFVAGAPGGQDFLAPVVSTDALTIDVAGLPAGAMPSYFVVRATDKAGNEEENEVEKSVTFAPNRLVNLGSYETGKAGDIAVNTAGTLVAMGGFTFEPSVHAWLFDVTDPANPQIVKTQYGPGRSTDVEIRGNMMWVSTEDDPTLPPTGAYGYDITDPANPVLVSRVRGTGLGQCHTIWLDGNILYCASSDDGEIHLVDVTDPAVPVHLSKIGLPSAQIHDMYIQGDFAVGCFLWDGFAFIDLTDKANPVITEQVAYESPFTHNAWPTPDLHYLYTTDENQDGHLRIWDIQNRADIKQVGEFIADPGVGPHAIVHNVQIVGNLAYVAWYEAGVQVLDITNPVDPVLIGFHDTFEPETQGWFAGAWGVAPKPPYLYVSDYTYGLWTYRLDP